MVTKMTNDINPPGGAKGVNPATPPRPATSPSSVGVKPGMPGSAGASAQKPGMSTPGATASGGPAFTASAGKTVGSMGATNAQKNTNEVHSNPELIMSIPVEVQIVLGSTTMPVANLMDLGRGSVITLDKQIGDPVDIIVNGRIIARGEVIVLEDDPSRFGVSLTEVMGK
ncbi:flagellar motor switch protein FliN [Bartonella schoenbuchensis m07a]|uniref:Flagellar motor switch protein FliN n=2 Tax=Bartonella schoenbuchensis TaxID=165694 RepID=N6UK15_9HYPH|nr:flagellar motor switch protein FliN [Bartonella schoenbuchensis m07a]